MGATFVMRYTAKGHNPYFPYAGGDENHPKTGFKLIPFLFFMI